MLFSHRSGELSGGFSDQKIFMRNQANKKLYASFLRNPLKLKLRREKERTAQGNTSAKYLLISAFLASRNPATLDSSLFDSTGGSSSRKRKRKLSDKSMEQKETAEQELLLNPGSFPVERLLAIFQCITSVGEGPLGEEDQEYGGLGIQDGNGMLMSDVLLQLSSLCSVNFIVTGGSCPLEGSTQY